MIRGLVRAVKEKRLSPRDIQSFLAAQIERHLSESSHELNTNSLVYVNPDLNHTGDLVGDAGLSHVPFTVKDNFQISLKPNDRIPFTCGSRMLKDFHSVHTASAVQPFLSDGALFVGKVNMDEFAMGCGSVDNEIHGPVINPWSPSGDDLRISGGSSGGSAASVASGLALFSVASDTGGSARLPAALCGVVGYKPTYGLVSRSGLVPLANQLDTPSLIANKVDDIRLLLNSWLSNPSSRSGDATLSDFALSPPNKSPATKLKIGIPAEFFAPGLTEEIAQLWDQTAALCSQKLGHEIVAVSLPHTPYSIPVYSVICCVAVASNMARYDGIKYGYRSNEMEIIDMTVHELIAKTRAEALGDVVRQRILTGNYFLMREQKWRHLNAARQYWKRIKNDFDQVFQQVDFLLAPIHLQTAQKIDEFRRLDSRTRTSKDDVCTVPVNLAGLPAISIPIKLSQEDTGMPLSLQLIGPRWSDHNLLDLAESIEQLANFPILNNFCNQLGV